MYLLCLFFIFTIFGEESYSKSKKQGKSIKCSMFKELINGKCVKKCGVNTVRNAQGKCVKKSKKKKQVTNEKTRSGKQVPGKKEKSKSVEERKRVMRCYQGKEVKTGGKKVYATECPKVNVNKEGPKGYCRMGIEYYCSKLKKDGSNTCQKWKDRKCLSKVCIDPIQGKKGYYHKCAEDEPNKAKYNKCKMEGNRGYFYNCKIAIKGGTDCMNYKKSPCGGSSNKGCCKDNKSCLVKTHPKCGGKPNCCIKGVRYWMECKKERSSVCECRKCYQGSCVSPIVSDIDLEKLEGSEGKEGHEIKCP